jgi:uncharacterized membrane protein AbrB (regulator of aidB expression)
MAWAALLLTSVLFGSVLSYAGMPAPVLIGSLLAGIVFATNGVHAKIPRPLFLYAQGVAGVLVASSLTHSTVGQTRNVESKKARGETERRCSLRRDQGTGRGGRRTRVP